MSALVCVVDGDRCQPHELGEIEPEEKCPGLCDAPACLEEISAESSRSEESFCAGHLALDEAGADLEEMAAAANKASMYGVTLSRLLREAVRLVPTQPEVDRAG